MSGSLTFIKLHPSFFILHRLEEGLCLPLGHLALFSFFGFRHFGPRVAFGAPFLYGAYAGYPYYAAYGDDCLAPRRIWTPYGWRIRLVNVCY